MPATLPRRSTHGAHRSWIQVGQTKQIIEQTNSEFPATQQKLIHSGKVLKDDAVLQDSGVKENEFLVVMLTKVRW